MEATEALLGLAQFALALAGFTGVVIAFGWRGGEWHAADAFRTWRALNSSLGAAFLALVPVALEQLGVHGEPLWRWSSLVICLYTVCWVSLDAPRHWRLRAELRAVIPAWGPRLLYASVAVIFAAQALNGLGLWWAPQPGVYFVGLIVFLLLPALIFGRIPFVRPGP
jgi:hypothetical protein